MQISLTGNPFVDTGLGVIASLSDCKTINDLDLEKVQKLHADGKSLARWNSKLKSTKIVFGMNSLILQNQIEYEKRLLYYSKMTNALLSNIGLEDVQERCESCGNRYSLDINKLFTKTLVPLGYTKGKRYVGRDWFPLAGSMGNDAQAFPAASRAPNLCAKCLFAVHYLPLGVILINGKLAVFQSTSINFWYKLVNDIAKEVKERILYANILNTIGSKEGSAAAVTRILNVMRDMHEEDLEPETSVFVWTFSNSGTGPYCNIEEIPTKSLRFLYEAIRHVPREEIIELVVKDTKNSQQYSFLNCISKGIDYRNLYPYKKFNGVSTKLFSLYQTIICNISIRSLNTAFKISKYVLIKTKEKEFESIGKDIDADLGKQNIVKGFIAQMIKEGIITFDEYSELFLSNANRVVKLNNSAWKFIKYYMHNLTVSPYAEIDLDLEKNSFQERNIQEYRVNYIASVILNLFVQQKSIVTFQRVVLERLAHREIGIEWLRRQFIKLAYNYEGFTYVDWKYLCVDDNGREALYDLLFTLRVLWIELIRRPVQHQKLNLPAPNTMIQPLSAPLLKLPTDLAKDYENTIKLIISDYIAKHGITKFQDYILDEVMDSTWRGLNWFKQQLSKYDKDFENEDYWENRFLRDLNGNSIKRIRFFQLHLLLANSFREYLFKEQPKSFSVGRRTI